jgi:hypothetical protein
MAWPLRVADVQPPTALIFSIWCDEEKQIYISAPFAVLVLNGVPRSGHQQPATTLWVMLYAQVAQLDNEDADSNSNTATARRQFRNVLLSTAEAGVQAFGDGEFVPTRVISVRRAEDRWQLIAL